MPIANNTSMLGGDGADDTFLTLFVKKGGREGGEGDIGERERERYRETEGG